MFSHYWTWRKAYRREVFFFIKILNFYKKKQLLSKKALPARLLSGAKNSGLKIMSSSRVCFIKFTNKIGCLTKAAYFC